MTTIEILRAARELLSDERNWTRGSAARDVLGYSVSPVHGDAVCWCAYGAIERVTPYADITRGQEAEEAVESELPSIWRSGLHRFNDAPRTTHADVLKLFDTTIARLESGGA